MKLSWLSNAPFAPSGYGNQTKLFAPRLQTILGHEVAVICFWGLDAGVLNYPDGGGGQVMLYPKGAHPWGQDVFGAHAAHFGADLGITLMDSWVCSPEMYGPLLKWAPWYPVDSEPLPRIIREKVAKAYERIVYSRFGERMTADAGLSCRYVPHAVDTAAFSPGDKAVARADIGLPADRYIVGMVAANKGVPSRKAFGQQIEAFARFHRRHPDALLYLHTARGDMGLPEQMNLAELVAYLGIQDAVTFSEPYGLLLGFPDDKMASLYRSFDVLLSVSTGEGFGIPILESQACGTPVIVGDWTAMSELCFGGWAIPKSESEPWWTPLATYQYWPRIGAIETALDAAYDQRGNAHLAEQARAGALAYDADLVTETYWKPVLDELGARIAEDKKQVSTMMPAGGLGSANGPGPRLVLPPMNGNGKPNRAERRALARAGK